MKQPLLLLSALIAFNMNTFSQTINENIKTEHSLGLTAGAVSGISAIASHFIYEDRPTPRTFKNGFTYISAGAAILSVILLIDSSHRTIKQSRIQVSGNGISIRLGKLSTSSFREKHWQ